MAQEARFREGLIGKPAPDFVLTVLDANGRTRRVTKADLAGKFVLLELWATWCGPCFLEMPHMQELAERYAKGDDFVVVAVSQDTEPPDPQGLRKLVEECLRGAKLDLLGRENVLVALDPLKSIGTALGSYAIPTALILDRKGIVRAASVGSYSQDMQEVLGLGANPRDILERELDRLLDVPQRKP